MMPRDRALELLFLARDDEYTAHVLQADPGIRDATVGFHYQQALEKLLKALLADRNIDFPRTHDLIRLIELVEAAGYQLPVPEDSLARMTPFAVAFRYDQRDTNQLDRAETEVLVRRVREWVESELE